MTSIFKKAKQNPHRKRCFSLGRPEAEAETQSEGPLSIKNLFVDEMHVMDALNDSKFIISGRKGTGKTAIKSYIILNSKPEDQTLLSYEIDPRIILSETIREDIQDFSQRVTLMSQWCIVSAIINMILDTDQGPSTPEIQNLAKLRKKYLDLFTIDDIVKFGKIERRTMSVNLLKGPFGALFSKEETRDDSKPQPFYRFINPLTKVIEKVLSMQVFEDYEFKVLIDNLDIGFDLFRREHCDALLALIRSARDFNNRPAIRDHAQVILFIRDDVRRHLGGMDSDPSKMFGSYELPLIWYEGKNISDINLRLRRFVNKRIAENFTRNRMPYFREDPWKSYVEEREEYDDSDSPKSVFRRILDYTFFRPRDLINLFLPLDTVEYQLPLSRDNIKKLLRDYSEKVFDELKDELKIKYPAEEYSSIISIISKIAKLDEQNPNGIDRKDVELLLPEDKAPEIIREFYDYDILGYIDNNGDRHFHCRNSMPVIPVEECRLVMPRILKLYFNRSYRIKI